MIDQINLNVTYSVVVLVIFVLFHLFSTHGAPTYEHTVHCKKKISWVIGSVPLAKYRLDTKPFYIGWIPDMKAGYPVIKKVGYPEKCVAFTQSQIYFFTD